MAKKAKQQVVRAKLVMIGAPNVGKTSLVRRFVHSTFSDQYRSTLGVKIDRKIVVVEQALVTMLLWDMHGEAEGLDVPANYLRGSAAAVAVFDATRPETIDVAANLLDRVLALSPAAYAVAMANKSDLDPDWAQVNQAASAINTNAIFQTSAKSGDQVEEAFTNVATEIFRRSSS